MNPPEAASNDARRSHPWGSRMKATGATSRPTSSTLKATLGALVRRPARPPVKSATPRVTAAAIAARGERGVVMAGRRVCRPPITYCGHHTPCLILRRRAAGGSGATRGGTMSGGPVVAAPEQGDADAAQLARFGYGQELKRVLNLFENFAVAFCYLSPVCGIYHVFTP